jgi:hypothetical protein
MMRGALSVTLQKVHFYETPATLPGAFDSLLGGFFLVKGVPLCLQLGTLTTFALALFAAARAMDNPRPWRKIAFVSAWLTFTGIWLFLLQPWDELFINLRHSLNFAQAGRYSFNAHQWLEGTVDFLPYLVLGLVAKCGFPLLDAAFLQSYLGGVACLLFGFLLFRLIKRPKAEPFFFLALSIFPPLAYNAGTGFATTVFCATILGSVFWLFFTSQVWIGLLGLALLPLVRMEASLLSVLLLAVWLHVSPGNRTRKGLAAVFVLLPAAAHALIRQTVYGQWLPLPVQFKSTLGSVFFAAVGVRNLLADSIATHTLTLGVALLLLQQLCRRQGVRFALGTNGPPDGRRIGLVLVAMALFTLPYYLSGGDWFPSYWARYLLPLSVFLFIATAVCFALHASILSTTKISTALWVPFVFFVVSSLWPISSTWKIFDHVFANRRTLAMTQEPTIARGHFRIAQLSMLGEHLRRTTQANDRIGSSELATIMYFAQREAVDFLGVINPAIAQSPLRELPSLIRKFPYRSELPYLIFKRVNPALLEQTQPEILYTFDFLVRDQMKELRPYEIGPTTLFTALARWEKQLGGLVEPLYGGLTKVLALGYEPVVVRAGEDFMAMYFVHHSILQRHLAALKSNGYHGGLVTAQAP